MEKVARIVEEVQAAGLGEIPGCSLDDLSIVFKQAHSDDLDAFHKPACIDDNALDRADTAGILAVCCALWKRVIEDGRWKVAEADARGEVNLYCCIKTQCSHEKFEFDEDNRARVVRVHHARCFFQHTQNHFDVLTRVVLRTIKGTVTETHLSMDAELLDMVTELSRRSYAALLRRSPGERVIEEMAEDCVWRARLAMMPGAKKVDVAIPVGCSDNYTTYPVDLDKEMQVALEYHRRKHGCTIFDDCEAVSMLRTKMRELVKIHGRAPEFYIFAHTNSAIRFLFKDLERGGRIDAKKPMQMH